MKRLVGPSLGLPCLPTVLGIHYRYYYVSIPIYRKMRVLYNPLHTRSDGF
jgi:hypothetical protein